jgi:hypothetical protein
MSLPAAKLGADNVAHTAATATAIRLAVMVRVDEFFIPVFSDRTFNDNQDSARKPRADPLITGVELLASNFSI